MADEKILTGQAGKAEGLLRRRGRQIDEAVDEATKVAPEEPMVPKPTNGNGNGNGMRRRRDNYPWD